MSGGMRLMSRTAALAMLEGIAVTGTPIHPRHHQQLAECVGALTPAESEHLNLLATGAAEHRMWAAQELRKAMAPLWAVSDTAHV